MMTPRVVISSLLSFIGPLFAVVKRILVPNGHSYPFPTTIAEQFASQSGHIVKIARHPDRLHYFHFQPTFIIDRVA